MLRYSAAMNFMLSFACISGEDTIGDAQRCVNEGKIRLFFYGKIKLVD